MAAAIWPPCEVEAVRHTVTVGLTSSSGLLGHSPTANHVQGFITNSIGETEGVAVAHRRACECIPVRRRWLCMFVSEVAAPIWPIADLRAPICRLAQICALLDT